MSGVAWTKVGDIELGPICLDGHDAAWADMLTLRQADPAFAYSVIEHEGWRVARQVHPPADPPQSVVYGLALTFRFTGQLPPILRTTKDRVYTESFHIQVNGTSIEAVTTLAESYIGLLTPTHDLVERGGVVVDDDLGNLSPDQIFASREADTLDRVAGLMQWGWERWRIPTYAPSKTQEMRFAARKLREQAFGPGAVSGVHQPQGVLVDIKTGLPFTPAGNAEQTTFAEFIRQLQGKVSAGMGLPEWAYKQITGESR